MTLRKDVKVGLSIAAIAVAVVGVYMLLSALTGKPGTTEQPVASTETPAPTDAVIPAPGSTPASTASIPAPTSVPGSGDIWDQAFATGTIPTAGSVIRNPADVIPASNTTPASVVGELNRPIGTLPAPTAGGVTQTSMPAGTAPGSANASAPIAAISQPMSVSTTPAIAASAETTHRVQAGETLSSIAAKHYGNPNLFTLLARANPQIDPNRLRIGAQIKVPPAPGTTPSATGSAPEDSTATLDQTKQYRVQAGDTLSGIAIRLYGNSSRWQRIYELNKDAIGNDPGRLKLGTVLVLPEAPTRR
jgi:nucleoid-associated protein YgaU